MFGGFSDFFPRKFTQRLAIPEAFDCFRGYFDAKVPPARACHGFPHWLKKVAQEGGRLPLLFSIAALPEVEPNLTRCCLVLMNHPCLLVIKSHKAKILLGCFRFSNATV